MSESENHRFFVMKRDGEAGRQGTGWEKVTFDSIVLYFSLVMSI